MDFKNYFALLINEATREEIKKFYPQIDIKDYNTILDGDPTGTKTKVGNLSRLVLDLYKKDKFELEKERLFDIYTAFDTVQRKKDSLTGTEFEKYRNLNMITSTETLMNIKYYLDQKASSKIKLKAGEGQDVDIFYEDENWVIKIPLDYKASVRLGRDVKGEWCVSSSSAMVHYNRYIAQDDIYFFINKSTNESYLYFDHGRYVEFHNIKNTSADLKKIIKENHLEKALSKIEVESKKIQTDRSYYEKRLLERYRRVKSPYVILTVLDGGEDNIKNSDSLIGKLFSIYKPNLDEELLISEGDNGKTFGTLNLALYEKGSKHTALTKNSKELISAYCVRFNIKNYTFTSNLTIDVKGNVTFLGDMDLHDEGGDLTELPISFRKVTGSFSFMALPLQSLEGFPEEVGKYFEVIGTDITSLEGGPRLVGGDYSCISNPLTSLKGAPKKVNGEFDCSECDLDSLEGCPEEVSGDFRCYSNSKEFTEDEVRKICRVGGKVVC